MRERCFWKEGRLSYFFYLSGNYLFLYGKGEGKDGGGKGSSFFAGAGRAAHFDLR